MEFGFGPKRLGNVSFRQSNPLPWDTYVSVVRFFLPALKCISDWMRENTTLAYVGILTELLSRKLKIGQEKSQCQPCCRPVALVVI